MKQKIYPVPESFASTTHIHRDEYQQMYAQSVQDPERFWSGIGQRIDWIQKFSKVKDTSFAAADCHVRWFYDGKLNVSSNCLDRHLETRGDKTALIWESDDPQRSEHISYRQLYERVCQCANALKSLGVTKGDRVTIYLPMIPEIAIAMLACARIGAIHSVVFGGFSSEALGSRIAGCNSAVVITADEGIRGGKRVALKVNVDGALSIKGTECVKHVLVVRRTGARVPMYSPRDQWYDDIVLPQAKHCLAATMDAEDPLFILYTSGSTGQPKGVLHSSGGYLVYAAFTHQTIFDLREDDIFWATADIGWVTGHSYIVYGPLANGATSVMFEGVPNYPDTGRFWEIVDKHKITILYSSPTAIRSLMREGEAPVKAWSRQSLRLLGSVGEPINPEAW